jgi:hypothetical protein
VARGHPPSFGSAFAAGLRRLPQTVVASIIVFILSTVGFGLAFSPALVAFARVRSASLIEIVGAVGPVLLVCLLLLIPVLYVLSRIQLFLVVLLSEGRGPLHSIAASWRLIGGNWWRVSNVVLILGIIVYVLIVVFGGLTGTIALMTAGFSAADLKGAAVTMLGVEVLTGGLVRIVSAPLLAALHVTLYQDLRLRKGFGSREV